MMNLPEEKESRDLKQLYSNKNVKKKKKKELRDNPTKV